MANNKIYMALVIVGAVVAICGIVMRFSGNASLHEAGTVVGWVGIIIFLFGRIVFGRKRSSPSSRDRS